MSEGETFDRQVALNKVIEVLESAEKPAHPRRDLFRIGLILGLVAGAIAALLFAPRSGSATRSALREGGLGLKDQVEDSVRQIQASLFRMLDRLQGV